MGIPISTSITMRPAWARRQRRVHRHALVAPSDKEKHDAIKILADERLCELEPWLWIEAQTILDESCA